VQGLDPALKTVLVFYGGLGTPRMLKIAEGDASRISFLTQPVFEPNLGIDPAYMQP
jgi:hypothetical protein